MEKDPTSSKDIFTSVTRKTFVIMMNSALLGVIGLISFYYIANQVSVSDYGMVISAMAFAGLFSLISDLGFGSAHIKRVSEGQDLGRCIGTYFAVKIVLILAFVISVIAGLFFWTYVLGRGFETKSDIYMILIMIIYFVATQLSSVGTQTIIAKVETTKQQLLSLIPAIIQLFATLYVVLFAYDLYIFGLTWVLGAMVQMLISFFFLMRFPIRPPSKEIFKSYSKFVIPLLFTVGISQLPTTMDKLLIKLFWNNYEVGIYSGGARFSIYLTQMALGLGLILLPTISSLSYKKDLAKVKSVMYSAEHLISLVMAPACAIIMVLALPIVTILGDVQYTDSYIVLVPYAIWGYIRSLAYPYGNMILGMDHPWVNTGISTFYVALIMIFYIIFIPPSIFGIPFLGMGAVGAAMALLITEMITTTITRYFSYKYAKAAVNTVIIKHIIAASIVGVILYGYQQFLPAERFYMLAAYGFAGMIIYFFIVLLIKGITNEEIRVFKTALSPLNIAKYMRDELQNKEQRK